ncbi:MAG: DUF484 family protein, partial [Alphaproteobacteria bacterium]
MSKPSSAPGDKPRALAADDVAEYLRSHPEFLEKYPDLLTVLKPPAQFKSNGAKVVDLQTAMIGRLQGSMTELKSDLAELIAATRSNLTSQARIHSAALDIINARSFEQFVETITTDLAVKLDVDVVRLCIENTERVASPKKGLRLLSPGTVDGLLGQGRDTLLRPFVGAEPQIYGSAASLVKSDVLLRVAIATQGPRGLLAIGSREAGHFKPNQGTDLLTFMARVI